MQIRYATAKDVPQLSALFRQDAEQHQARAGYYTLYRDFEWHTFVKSRLDGSHGRILVAERNGALAGFVSFKIEAYPPRDGGSVLQRIRRGPRKKPPFPVEPLRFGLIEQCFVTLPERRQGTGKLLVEAAMKWFKVKKIHRIELSMVARNQEAEYFLRHMGFETFRLSFTRDI